MTRDRYNELMEDSDKNLTQEEIAQGWWFCIWEWDGLLVHESEEDGKHCMATCECHKYVRKPENG